MSCSKWSRVLRFLLLGCVLKSLPVLSQDSRPVMHVMFAVDHEAEKVGKDLNNGGFGFLVTANLPEPMYRFYSLQPHEFEETRIVERIRQVQTNPNDTFVFFYVGHGSSDPNNSTTWLELSATRKSDTLYATEILQEIRNKNVRLGVVILDCCNRQKAPPAMLPSPGFQFIPRESPTPLFDSLFIRPSGLILIESSSQGEYALVKASGTKPDDMPIGPLFSNAFAGTLLHYSNQPLNWQTVISETQSKLDDNFAKLVGPQGIVELQNGQVVRQRRQTIQLNFYR